MDGGILIVGGYGVVGRRIAADLAPDYLNQVFIAGRDLTRAEATAAQLGYGVRGVVVDVADDLSIAKALNGVALVVSCIDQPDRKLFWAAIKRSVCYTDITPHLTALGRGSAYDAVCTAAREAKAKVVLGTGLVPGISNVVVRALADRLGGAEEIETVLLLNANDISGRASFEYFLQELSVPFRIWQDGCELEVRPFTKPLTVAFPNPIGEREAYLFPFSDQVLYPRTMGAKTAITRLALRPEPLARLLHLLAVTGATGLVADDRIRHLVASTRKDGPSTDGKPLALRVKVAHHGKSNLAILSGRAQADWAAAGTSETVRVLLSGAVEPGAWMPEQIVEPSSFFAGLKKRGLAVKFALDEPSNQAGTPWC